MVANSISCTDHLGNTYESIYELSRHYKINYYTLRDRIKKGISIEKAVLTRPVRFVKVRDHLGNEYPSVKCMCYTYRITPMNYQNRKRIGWNLKDILTKPVRVYAEKISD